MDYDMLTDWLQWASYVSLKHSYLEQWSGMENLDPYELFGLNVNSHK